VLLAAGLLIALYFARTWPKEQTVHYVLADAAPRVAELDARWAPASDGDDWVRQATFQYAPGTAPRIVTHEPRLPDGEYTVEIEIVAANERSTVRRHVTLSGGATSIELAQSVPHARAESARSPESETEADPRSGAEVRAAGVPLEHPTSSVPS
jgi:hypothetical protein